MSGTLTKKDINKLRDKFPKTFRLYPHVNPQWLHEQRKHTEREIIEMITNLEEDDIIRHQAEIMQATEDSKGENDQQATGFQGFFINRAKDLKETVVGTYNSLTGKRRSNSDREEPTITQGSSRQPNMVMCTRCSEPCAEQNTVDCDTAPSPHTFCATCINLFVSNAMENEDEEIVQQESIECCIGQCTGRISKVVLSTVLEPRLVQLWNGNKLTITDEDMQRCIICEQGECEKIGLDEDQRIFRCATCTSTWCRLCHVDWAIHSGKECEEALLASTETTDCMRKEKTATSASLSHISQASSIVINEADVIECYKCAEPLETGLSNNVICSNCGVSTCWKCGCMITRFDHFSRTGCKLMGGNEEKIGKDSFAKREISSASSAAVVQLLPQKTAENGQEITQLQYTCSCGEACNITRDDASCTCGALHCVRCKTEVKISHFVEGHCGDADQSNAGSKSAILPPVDKKGVRKELEERLSEFVIKKCPKCTMPYAPDAICNYVTCICEATLCFRCNKIVGEFTHFGYGGCSRLRNFNDEQHAREALIDSFTDSLTEMELADVRRTHC